MTPGTLDVLLDLRNRRYWAARTPETRPMPAKTPDPDPSETPTVEITVEWPGAVDADEVTYEPVTVWVPPDFFSHLQTIQRETGESLGDAMLRHSKSNVATEAVRIRAGR